MLTVTDVLVFDGESSELVETSITVDGGRIVEVGGKASGETIEGRGRVLTPGLIDAHCHAYGIGLDLLDIEATPLSYVSLKASHRLGAALSRGFTTIRDVAGGDIGLARAIDDGLLASPRYFYSGRALTQTGGHADPRPADRSVDTCCSHTGEIVDGVDAVRAAVRERFRTGSHCIKIMASGGVVSLTDPLRIPQYSAEEIRAAVDEATRRGSYVAAHAYSAESIVHAVGNGVRTVEHGNLIDEPAARLMAERGAYLVPTLVTYSSMGRRGAELGLSKVGQEKNAEVLEAGLRSLEIARAAGVSIGLGTDLMGDLEVDQLDEFRIRCEAEDPVEVLRSATSVNASILGRSDLGRIAPGCLADMVIFERNPFEDPSVLWDARARTVIQAGTVV
ncbi:MAG: amidohydrolase family protein [Acidimicrobiia bacterium]|nr:amidohydrolase family protein [Acidimicrobiia bacterium]